VNKKGRTWLFMLAGTLVEILMALAFFVLFMVVIMLLRPITGDMAAGNMIMIAFIGGVALAMFLYQKLVKWVVEKYNLEDKLEPLTGLRRRTPKKPKL
jgi:uncharacterized membrane protein YdbT with pleckstrin-like domain